MKRNLLSLSILLSAFSFGQSFTSANEYAIGATQAMFKCDTAAPMYESVTGSNCNWDYSAYNKMSNPNTTYQVIANTNTSFPNSNKVANVVGVLDTYLKTTTSNKSSEGFQFTDQTLGVVTANFSSGDNMNIMDYDFTLNESISDVFSGSISGTGIINPACSGSSISTFDGVGTLNLGGGLVKTGVARHHLYTELNATSLLGPVILKLDQYEYFDFTGSNLPLLTMTKIRIFLNGAQVTSLKFLLNSNGSVTVSELELSNLSIYPNPAQHTIHVSSNDFNGTEQFVITDLAGKKLLESSDKTISIESLNAGYYLVHAYRDGLKTSRVIVKQ